MISIQLLVTLVRLILLFCYLDCGGSLEVCAAVSTSAGRHTCGQHLSPLCLLLLWRLLRIVLRAHSTRHVRCSCLWSDISAVVVSCCCSTAHSTRIRRHDEPDDLELPRVRAVEGEVLILCWQVRRHLLGRARQLLAANVLDSVGKCSGAAWWSCPVICSMLWIFQGLLAEHVSWMCKFTAGALLFYECRSSEYGV